MPARTSRLWLEFIGSMLLIAAVGWVDAATGFEIILDPLYVLPILALTLRNGVAAGFLITAWSLAVWGLAEWHSAPAVWPWYILAVNGGMRLGVDTTVILVTAALKAARDEALEQARTDPLTKAANLRQFVEVAGAELERARRYKRPFTLAYVDLDHFKSVNDRHGHLAGDDVLKLVGEVFRTSIRATDLVARLGGDEFALLLPETDTASARLLLQRIVDRFGAEMKQRNYPVTFSIGAVTFEALPDTVQDMLQEADRLMYKVKNSGKNRIDTAMYTGKERSNAPADTSN